jgi:hypothetical protein
MLARRRLRTHRQDGDERAMLQVIPRDLRHAGTGPRYLEAASDAPTTAWPAARRAVSTRNGEQLT